MRILNTGGTFNKRYDPVKGELFVPKDNAAVDSILQSLVIPIFVEGIVYKDSLEMDHDDRSALADAIASCKERIVIVVHGTDTMGVSAEYVSGFGMEKVIVFTGAMIPFSIDPIEATANLAMAIAYAHTVSNGVYIVMQGVMGEYGRVKKNKTAGKFEYV
ncbi:MAG: asparaginase domain-containing protein [Sulfuricurvum sp.]|nr:asparaginase domain-containing protein [Sulfuricurvum sp.]